MELENVKFEGYVELRHFLEVLRFCNQLVSEVYVKANEYGWTIEFVDPTNSATAHIELGFVSAKGECNFGLDVNRLVEILPIIFSGDIVVSVKIGTIKTRWGSFEGVMVSYGNFHYTLALIDADAIRKPKVNLEEFAEEIKDRGCEISFTYDELKKAIEGAVTDSIYFEVGEDNIMHNGAQEIKLSGYCATVEKSVYSIDLLRPLLVLKSIDSFSAYFRSAEPMLITPEGAHSYYLLYIITPMPKEIIKEFEENYLKAPATRVDILHVENKVFKAYKRSLKSLGRYIYLAVKNNNAYFISGIPRRFYYTIIPLNGLDRGINVYVDEKYYEINLYNDFKKLIDIADELELYQSEDKLYFMGSEIGIEVEPFDFPDPSGEEIELSDSDLKEFLDLLKDSNQVVIYHERGDRDVYIIGLTFGEKYIEVKTVQTLYEHYYAHLPNILEVYESRRLAKYGSRGKLYVSNEYLYIMQIKEVRFDRRYIEDYPVRVDLLPSDRLFKENESIRKMVVKAIKEAIRRPTEVKEEKSLEEEQKKHIEGNAKKWIEEVKHIKEELIKPISNKYYELEEIVDKVKTKEEILRIQNEINELLKMIDQAKEKLEQLLSRWADLHEKAIDLGLDDLALDLRLTRQDLDARLKDLDFYKRGLKALLRELNEKLKELEKEEKIEKITEEKVEKKEEEFRELVKRALKGDKDAIEKVKDVVRRAIVDKDENAIELIKEAYNLSPGDFVRQYLIPRVISESEFKEMIEKVVEKRPPPLPNVNRIEKEVEEIRKGLREINESLKKLIPKPKAMQRLSPREIEAGLKILEKIEDKLKEYRDKISDILEELEKSGLEKSKTYEKAYGAWSYAQSLIEKVERLKKQIEKYIGEEESEVLAKLIAVFESFLMGADLPEDKIHSALEEYRKDIELLSDEVSKGRLRQREAVKIVQQLARDIVRREEQGVIALPKEAKLPQSVLEMLSLAEELMHIERRTAKELAKTVVEKVVEETIEKAPGIYVIEDETGKEWFQTNDKVKAGYMASKLSLEHPDKIFTIYKIVDDFKQKLEVWKGGAVEPIVPFWEW